MVSSSNSGKKTPSGFNQKPNPAGKRKASDQAGGQSKQQKLTKEQEQTRAAINKKIDKQNAVNTLRHFLDSPRGVDKPGGTHRAWLRQQEVELLVSYKEPTEEGHISALLHGWKAKLVAASNAPALQLIKDKHVFTIRSENFAALGDRGTQFLEAIEYESEIMNHVALKKAFAAQHRFPGMTEDQAKGLIAFGDVENEELKKKGIHCMTLKTKGELWLDYIPKDGTQSTEVLELLKYLNQGSRLTVIRKLKDYKPSIYGYWSHLTEKACLKGVWHHYEEEIGKCEGQLFKAWEKNPDTEIKHQLWMEIIDLQKTSSKIKKFASQALKRSFGSMKELEIVECIAIIYETMYENQIIREYFDWNVFHDALVTKSENGYIQLDVSVKKQDDVTMPPVALNTKFKMSKVILRDPDRPVYDPMADNIFPEEDEEVDPEVPFHSGPRYDARTIDVSIGGDFCLSTVIENETERAQFREGRLIKVALHMTRNPIPSQRQLRAVAKCCKTAGNKDPWKFRAMQNFLKGAGNPDADDGIKMSVLDDCMSRLNEQQKRELDEYILNLDLNQPQKDVWNAIFKHRYFVTQLQGPPGTGKTTTVAIIAATFAMLGLKTALCAPSNVATEQCLLNVASQMEFVYGINPELRKTLKVVYLPTTATTKASLRETGDQQSGYDYLAESEKVDEYRDYKLHAHVVRSFQSRVQLKTGSVGQAIEWLEIRDRLLKGGSVGNKKMRQWVDLAIAEGENVLNDPAVKIVISTNNNADQIAAYGYKPTACIMDECAFSTEPDALIPLSLRARFNVIVGDHEQLRPMVRSRGFNEFALQLGLSLYERFYGSHTVPLFRLKVNYRMHPDIADLPGMLSYEWLGCDESTSVASEAFLFFQNWYNSVAGRAFTKDTRPAEFKGKRDEGIRNRWVNPKGGFASHKPGTKSLRNFANINAAVDLITSLLSHVPTKEGIVDMKGSDITILSPYKADLEELRMQLEWALRDSMPEFQCVPEGTTIDKIQGGQNQIIILLLPQGHPEQLGFMKEWNRFNVALTRAKDCLYIIGPLDSLRGYLQVIVQNYGCRKLGLTIIDYLEKGRVIDIAGHTRLPASQEERATVPREQWSRCQNLANPDDLVLDKKRQATQDAYDAKQREKFEAELLKDLKDRRTKAADYLAKFKKGEKFEVSLKTNVDRNDDEAMDEDGPEKEAEASGSAPAPPPVGPNHDTANKGDSDLDKQIAAAIQNSLEGTAEFRKKIDDVFNPETSTTIKGKAVVRTGTMDQADQLKIMADSLAQANAENERRLRATLEESRRTAAAEASANDNRNAGPSGTAMDVDEDDLGANGTSGAVAEEPESMDGVEESGNAAPPEDDYNCNLDTDGEMEMEIDLEIAINTALPDGDDDDL